MRSILPSRAQVGGGPRGPSAMASAAGPPSRVGSHGALVRHRHRSPGPHRLRRRLADAVPRVRAGGSPARRGGLHRGRRDRAVADRAGSALPRARRLAHRLGHHGRPRRRGGTGRRVPRRRGAHRQPQPARQAEPRPLAGRLAAARHRALRRPHPQLVARPRPRPRRPGRRARRRRHRVAHLPRTRRAAAGRAARDPPRPHPERGADPQQAGAHGAAVGRRRRARRLRRLPRRAGRRRPRGRPVAGTS